MTDAGASHPGLDALFALDLFPVGIFQTDLLGRCVRINQRWSQLTGQAPEQALGYGFLDAIHPEDRPRVIEETRRHIEADRPLRVEYRLINPEMPEPVWVLVQAVAFADAAGNRVGYVGTVTDISARVRAEAALQASEERYRHLIEQTPEAVAVHRNGVVLYVNPAAVALMRAPSAEQLLGRHVLEFVHPAYHELVRERQRRLAAGEDVGPAEMEFLLCDGTIARVETVGAPTIFAGEPAAQLWIRDVTEQRKIEALYRVVVDSVRDPIWIADRDDAGEWRMVLVNQAYCRGGRVAPADVLGKSSRELAEAGYLSEALAQQREERYREAAASGRPLEYEMRGEWNGRPFHISTVLTPVADAGGECRRIVGWSRDLSRRLEQERLLAESEANYRAVVEGTSDAIWVVKKEPDGGYRVLLANPRTAELLQIPLEAIIGRRVEEVLPPGAAQRAIERYRQAEAAGGPIEYETVIERPGYRREVITHLTPIFDEAGHLDRIIGSARDATDRHKAELALLQAQKLESLGVLAGGIAHDFNNLLTTILGNLFLVRSELPPDSPLRAYLDDASVAGERGAELVRKLLSFSRPGITARERVSIRRLIDETVSLVRRTLTPAIALNVHSDPGDDTVIGEFSSLQQVLLNLLLNARDAMPNGGALTILHTRRAIGPEAHWARRGLLPGDYHEIAVIDSGTGMPPELLPRIFDPFFTTKGIGKGTGLGLSTALSIVRGHGGWLDVESELGRGSTFRVLLPVAPPPAEIAAG